MTIRSSRFGMDLQFDEHASFEEICDFLTAKFRNSPRFFGKGKMALSFSGRIPDRREEEKILKIIRENTELEIVCIMDNSEKTGIIYRSAVENTLANVQKREGQFYRGTLGKRQTLESDSSIVILGDVENGARVTARGNIVVVGGVYGAVHAGAGGDRNAYITALSMQPQQLMIGDIEAKRQRIYQESLAIKGPKIAVVDGGRIYLDPLVE